MKRFEKYQILITLLQSVILLAAFLAALYFGIKQKNINDTLSDIALFNHNQTITQQNFKIVQETRDLRLITNKIVNFFNRSTTEQQKAMKNRSYEDILATANEIEILLNNGLDNDLLKGNKEALLEWLKASESISGVIKNPTEFYKMEKGNSSVIMGPISARDYQEWKESNKQWKITPLTIKEIANSNAEQLEKVFQSVMKVHGMLDLSFRKLKSELSSKPK